MVGMNTEAAVSGSHQVYRGTTSPEASRRQSMNQKCLTRKLFFVFLFSARSLIPDQATVYFFFNIFTTL